MLTIGPAARLFPPRSSYHFPNGQTYVYAVEWHMFNAGTARVSMDTIGTEQRVTAIADSLGVVNLMFTVHDRFESYFDPRDFCSQRIVKRAEEGKRRRNSEVQFDYARGKAVRSDTDVRTGENKRVESDIPGCVTDAVTGFYYLASQPLLLYSCAGARQTRLGNTIISAAKAGDQVTALAPLSVSGTHSRLNTRQHAVIYGLYEATQEDSPRCKPGRRTVPSGEIMRTQDYMSSGSSD
jgi:hypothetical protein